MKDGPEHYFIQQYRLVNDVVLRHLSRHIDDQVLQATFKHLGAVNSTQKMGDLLRLLQWYKTNFERWKSQGQAIQSHLESVYVVFDKIESDILLYQKSSNRVSRDVSSKETKTITTQYQSQNLKSEQVLEHDECHKLLEEFCQRQKLIRSMLAEFEAEFIPSKTYKKK